MYLPTIESLYHEYVSCQVPHTLEGLIRAFRTGLDLRLRLGLELGEPPDWTDPLPPPGGPGG